MIDARDRSGIVSATNGDKMITFKGNIIYTKPFASVRVVPNWNDSMATYYPYLSVQYVNELGEISSESINVPELTQPEQHTDFVFEHDQSQLDTVKSILKARQDAEEQATIRLHKDVIVKRGRKVPKGTIGRVIWMGESRFGTSLRIETLQGEKLFVAMYNCETF